MAKDDRKPGDLSRRDFIKGTVAGAAVAAGGALVGEAAAADAAANRGSSHGSACQADPSELVLYNGKIHTMDDRDSVVSAVAIRDGRFVGVGGDIAIARNGRSIDLRGATVIPGLIESCDHLVSFGNYRPGYHTVIENARSIADIQNVLAARRPAVPAGEWITALGAWVPTMFAENRIPTGAELDAAVSDRPVLVYNMTVGPASTNSMGKALLRAASTPVDVADDGSIPTGIQSTTALYVLRLTQTPAQRRRTTLEGMAYVASLGLTSHIDQEGIPDAPSPQYDLGTSILSVPRLTPDQTLFNFDHFRHWDTWWSLHRQGRATVRMQADLVVSTLATMHERIKNQLPFFGDDMMMTHAMYYTPTGQVVNPTWAESQRVLAAAGWRSRASAGNEAQMETAVATWEQIDREIADITELRWTIHRLATPTVEQLKRLKAIGGTANVSAGSWVRVASSNPAAAPFRTVVDSGIAAGIHKDSGHIAPLNPWYSIHFAVTGVNCRGEFINPGQQLTRNEALRLHTRANAYQMSMENKIGSIEVGKLADLAVLNQDYFRVSDENIRNLHSILTIVDGKIIHDSGVLRFH